MQPPAGTWNWWSTLLQREGERMMWAGRLFGSSCLNSTSPSPSSSCLAYADLEIIQTRHCSKLKKAVAGLDKRPRKQLEFLSVFSEYLMCWVMHWQQHTIHSIIYEFLWDTISNCSNSEGRNNVVIWRSNTLEQSGWCYVVKDGLLYVSQGCKFFFCLVSNVFPSQIVLKGVLSGKL